jgi:hypothetical protein
MSAMPPVSALQLAHARKWPTSFQHTTRSIPSASSEVRATKSQPTACCAKDANHQVRTLALHSRHLPHLNLGVSPARMTLSLVAMHSTSSPLTYACGSLAARKMASPGARRTCTATHTAPSSAHQTPPRWPCQEPAASVQPHHSALGSTTAQGRMLTCNAVATRYTSQQCLQAA